MLLALFVLIVIMRLPLVWANGRFLGEEGAVFFAFAWHHGTIEALFRSFGGYLNLAANGATLGAARLVRSAPVTGLVNDVQVTTVGGFVNSGEKILQVVPVGDRLLVEARVSPKDIAFIKVGDRANVKVTSYDFSIYGGLSGTVRVIGSDSIYDEAERQAYYTVVVETDRSYITKGNQKLPIMPGMICDVEIITGSKSILTYLLKPVLRAFGQALTER